MLLGKIKGSEVRKNRDGEKPVRILQCEISDPDDIQSVELIGMDGEDTNPEDDTACIIIPLGEAYKVAIAVDDGIESTVDKGEKKIYSYENGVIKAFLHLLRTGEINLANDLGSIKIKPDGTVEINGSGDFAVGFTQLQARLIAMANIFSTHTHSNVTNGPSISGGPSATQTGDITLAKKTKIKLEA